MGAATPGRIRGPIDPPSRPRLPAGPAAATADGASLAFGHRTIRFVPARDGRTGIVAVDLYATDRDLTAGSSGTLCNTQIRFT